MGGALNDLCSFVMTTSEVENWVLACTWMAGWPH